VDVSLDFTEEPPEPAKESWEHEDDLPDVDAAATGGAGRAGKAVAVILVVVGLFFLFVLVRNDWQMSDPGTMMSRAFASEVTGGGVDGLDTVSVEPVVVERASGDRVLMVMGQVYNESIGTKRNVRVEARVRDSGGIVVSRREAPCGRIFSPEELRTMSDAEVAARYRSLEEDDRPLRPQASVSCSVVFERVPAGYAEATHRVELAVTRADPVTEGP
jgi:hypothetical protein